MYGLPAIRPSHLFGLQDAYSYTRELYRTIEDPRVVTSQLSYGEEANVVQTIPLYLEGCKTGNNAWNCTAACQDPHGE